MSKDFENFDKIAQDAFEGFEVDFNPEDWKRMETKLDKKEHLLPHIWLFKGIEAVVLLLVLFTSFHFWYSNTTNNSNVNANESGFTTAAHGLANDETTSAENQLYSDAAESESTAKENIKENTVNGTANQTFIPEYVENSASANDNSTFLLPNDTKILTNKEKKSALITKGNNVNNNLNNNVLNYNNSINNAKSKTTQTSGLSKHNMNTMLPPTIAIDNKSLNTTRSENQTIAAIATESNENNSTANKTTPNSNSDENSDAAQNLSNLSLEPIKLDKNTLKGTGNGGGDEEGKGFAIKNSFKFPKIYRRQTRFSLLAGADVSFANDLGDNNIGLSTGVLFEREISERFSLRSGLLTSRKNYENTFTKTIDHSATEGMIYESKVYQKTTLSVLSIPVYFTGVLFRKEKWRLSLSLGTSAAFLTNRRVSGTQRTTVYQAAGSVTAITELNPAAYEKGIFQGGNTQINMYMTAGFGADIERQLGNHVSLFVQPMYHHGLMSVGLGKDRLHTVSLNVGIKGVLR